MKKAALSFEMVYWIPRMLFVVAVVITIVMLLYAHLSVTLTTQPVRAQLFAYQAIYTEHGISAKDDFIQRAYPGIIDKDRFTQDVLEKSLYLGDNQMQAAKFSLLDIDEKVIATAIYNPTWYERWLPLTGFSGSGGALQYKKVFPVLIRDQGALQPGFLAIDVVMPNA